MSMTIKESAIRTVEAILDTDVLPCHKRDVINGMIWKITEAGGKYLTRYHSRAAWNAPRTTKRERDHVIPRKALIDAIMREPERARELLATAIACTVTKEEHARLTRVSREQPHLQGWQRYAAADILVVD